VQEEVKLKMLWAYTNVSEKYAVSIFRVEDTEDEGSMFHRSSGVHL
jgi:hypothetical protein